jgi:DNA (cytosine-5)-methyltransferase 1
MGGNKTPIIDELEVFEGALSFVEEYHARLVKGGEPYKGDAPNRLRRLTVDECLAIQTFPTGYKLAGEQSAMYRQIGNAVPCKLAEAVGTAVSKLLDVY